MTREAPNTQAIKKKERERTKGWQAAMETGASLQTFTKSIS